MNMSGEQMAAEIKLLKAKVVMLAEKIAKHEDCKPSEVIDKAEKEFDSIKACIDCFEELSNHVSFTDTVVTADDVHLVTERIKYKLEKAGLAYDASSDQEHAESRDRKLITELRETVDELKTRLKDRSDEIENQLKENNELKKKLAEVDDWHKDEEEVDPDDSEGDDSEGDDPEETYEPEDTDEEDDDEDYDDEDEDEEEVKE